MFNLVKTGSASSAFAGPTANRPRTVAVINTDARREQPPFRDRMESHNDRWKGMNPRQLAQDVRVQQVHDSVHFRCRWRLITPSRFILFFHDFKKRSSSGMPS